MTTLTFILAERPPFENCADQIEHQKSKILRILQMHHAFWGCRVLFDERIMLLLTFGPIRACISTPMLYKTGKWGGEGDPHVHVVLESLGHFKFKGNCLSKNCALPHLFVPQSSNVEFLAFERLWCIGPKSLRGVYMYV